MNAIFSYHEKFIVVESTGDRMAPFVASILDADGKETPIGGQYVSSARALYAGIKIVDRELLELEIERLR